MNGAEGLPKAVRGAARDRTGVQRGLPVPITNAMRHETDPVEEIIRRSGARHAAPGRAGRVAVLVLFGWLSGSGCGRGGAEPAPPQAQTPVAIGAQDAVRVESKLLSDGPALSGTLQARRTAAMRAEVQGAVLEMAVEQGQQVKKGQLLARLDDTTLREQVLAARTAVRVARNSVRLARAEEGRFRTLSDAGVITRRELDRAVLSSEQALAQLSDAQSRYALARQQLSRTRLKAPFAGVVSERHASAGDIVQPGTPLYTLIDPSSLRLVAAVPAAQLDLLELGTQVDFHVAGYGERTFEGRIERINPAVDPATGQVRLYVTLPNSGQALLTGLSAEGRVAALRREVAAVPVSVVDVRSGSPSVLRVREGRVERVPVTVGMRDEVARLVELRSGVRVGDVLLRGSARDLAEGSLVKVELPARSSGSEPGVGGSGRPEPKTP